MRPHQNRSQSLGVGSSIPEPRGGGIGPFFLGWTSAVIFGCRNPVSTAAPSPPSTLLTLPTPSSLPVSLRPLLPPCAPLSPTPSQLPHLHSPGSRCPPYHHLPGPVSQGSHTHTTFSVHLSHQDPHPGHSRAPTGTAKKLEPHFPVTSFPTHPAFTSSEEQQDVWVPPLTPEPHLLPAPSTVFFLADPHLNLGTLEVQGTRGEAELCDQQPWASAGDPTTRQRCLSPLL